jgi:predicted N-acyltransferase
VLVHHGLTVSMDLRLSDEERRQQVRRTHRKHIAQAHRAGVRLVVDDWSRLDAWVRTYHENMRRVGASAYYYFTAEHFRSLHEALDDRMHLALAQCGDEVLGGTVFFEHDGIMQAHLQSVRDGETFHADKLLYDAVREWGAARGNRLYHIGGGVGGGQDSLFFYKAGFSPTRHAFHTWRVVTDLEAYADLLGPRVHASDSMTGHFPPYR